MNDSARVRLLTWLIFGNLLLTAGVIGWAVWAANDPEYWFPAAFAAQGPRGEEGPRGERGARGPVGPAGPAGAGVEDVQATAEEAMSAAEEATFQAEDLSSRVDNLEGIDVYDLDSRLSEVESDISDVCDTLDYDLDLYVC